MSFGAAIVLPPNNLAATILGAANRHEGTLIYGSPMHYRWLGHAGPGASLPRLRLAISTTTGLDRDIADKFRQRFGLPLTQALSGAVPKSGRGVVMN